MTISPVLPFGYPQNPRFQANKAVKFGETVTAKTTDTREFDELVAKLPKSIGLAMERGLDKARATSAPELTALHMTYGMFSLVHDHLQLLEDASSISMDAELAGAQIDLYTELVPAEVRAMVPDKVKPAELKKIFGITMAQMEKEMLSKSSPVQKNPLPFNKDFEAFLRGFAEGVAPAHNNSKFMLSLLEKFRTKRIAAMTPGVAYLDLLRNDLLEQATAPDTVKVVVNNGGDHAGTSIPIVIVRRRAVEARNLADMNNDQINAVMADKSPQTGYFYQHAMEIAARANSATVEPIHFVLAMLRDIQQLPQLNPEWMTAAPDRVPNRIQTPSGAKIPVIFFRIALDALLPPDKRGDLTTDQITTLIAQAESTVEKLVYPEAPEISDRPVEPHISSSLADLFESVMEAPPGEYPYVLGERLHENLVKFRQKENKALGLVMKDLVGKNLVEIQGIPSQATSPKDFSKLLDKQFEQSKGAMSRKQYLGIKRLIGEYDAAKNPSDGDKIRQALDLLLNKMVWKYDEITLDPSKTAKVLDEEHTGLEKAKQDIVELVATMKRQAEMGLPTNGKIKGYVGPPGVGKTSLAKSLSKATGRKMARISLGGSRDASDINGHSRTYIGAKWGRLIEGFATARSMNPLFILDEIDKMSEGPQGSPAAVLLEALDPEQNHDFVDKFIPEVPVDLSQALVIVTANEFQNIPGPLRDRIDFMEFDAYDLEEKTAIAKDHLIPNMMKEKGLSKEEFNLSDDGLRFIIEQYTFEAGVRNLKKKLEALGNKVTTAIATGKPVGEIGPEKITELLGPSDISKPEPLPPLVGVGNGLAVLGEIGGAMLRFEADKAVFDQENPNSPASLTLAPGMPSKNMMEMTHDSFNTAYNWIRQNPDKLKELGFDLSKYKGKRIELGLRSETGGKIDGDSAGAIMTLTMVSALTGRKIRNDVAMTGTITYKHRTLAIGGLKQKLRGAMDSGMKVVFFPKANVKDYERIPERMKKDMVMMSMDEFKAAQKTGLPQDKMVVVPADNINDILDYCLLPQENAAKRTRKKAAAPVSFSGGFYPSTSPAAAAKPAFSVMG